MLRTTQLPALKVYEPPSAEPTKQERYALRTWEYRIWAQEAHRIADELTNETDSEFTSSVIELANAARYLGSQLEHIYFGRLNVQAAHRAC